MTPQTPEAFELEGGKEKHPKGLYFLFSVEMWERFSYYSMRALLILYLTKAIGYERPDALEIYGVFTGLVYLTPFLGGIVADKLLGFRNTIIIGGILMAVGQFCMMSQDLLFVGLGLIVMGNGFFKPNISSMVGQLYPPGSPLRDRGFTIFYMGINIGAFFAPLIGGTLGEEVGWAWGFGAAGVGMLIAMAWFFSRQRTLGLVGMSPSAIKAGRLTMTSKDWINIVGYIVASVLFVIGSLELWSALTPDSKYYLKMIGGIGGLLAFAFLLFKNVKGIEEWSRIGVVLILGVFVILFWMGFEQAGGTFNLFAEEQTDRSVFGLFEIPASALQSANPLLIVLFAPIITLLWSRLDKRKAEPNIPAKMGFGLILLGLGFAVMYVAQTIADTGVKVNLLWLTGVYIIHTVAELFLSPIGLSMVTKLSPQRIVALMMGFWFAATALGNYLSGTAEAMLHEYEIPLYGFLLAVSIGGGVILLAMSPVLKKMMRGVR